MFWIFFNFNKHESFPKDTKVEKKLNEAPYAYLPTSIVI